MPSATPVSVNVPVSTSRVAPAARGASPAAIISTTAASRVKTARVASAPCMREGYTGRARALTRERCVPGQGVPRGVQFGYLALRTSASVLLARAATSTAPGRLRDEHRDLAPRADRARRERGALR